VSLLEGFVSLFLGFMVSKIRDVGLFEGFVSLFIEFVVSLSGM